jgi:DNA-binding IclR family transcriptional regulator
MSHFVIWRNRIFLFGQYEDDLDISPQADETTQLIDAVRERLPKTELISFSEIAEALDAVPWDVLMVCRRLVRMGFAREGKRKQRSWFGRI